MVEKEETNLRVFNAAKLFAEKILFPMMEQYQTYQKQSDFGSSIMDDSLTLSEELRDIGRYNGLKGMADTCLNLAMAIKSTVYLKNNKEEMKQLNSIIDCMDRTKVLFYEHKHLFFKVENKNNAVVEVLNRIYFEKVKRIVQICYINTEVLMTRNRLLFSDASDEYKTDAEIQDEILKEYTEG